ncbi:DEAD/DEAH box helicase [Methylogaea oryzae]|uniref:DEAD-box ATP-dependent RNA helicase RhpA n=1 Tax=Methylogaea oryzae TaxID=1295382 RepID=A0A8D4VMK1_9GAMM|nr:DEAD/DEAH box helicase [Methylogaea oryzae]BBL70638.1 ATP-dependent RNA helicase RhlE [Methylogaea oryzae]
MPFTQLGLSAELLRAVSEEGYTKPTPIQQQAIPVVLEGRDILAGAQTGTGKTASFTLPLLQRLMETPLNGRQRVVRALILTPTRELAAQVQDSVRAYGKHLPLRSTVIFGGVSMVPQMRALRNGVDIVVATPGRLLDHVRQRTLDLSQVEMFVLDEADRMLDMGFIRDIRQVIAVLPKARQNLLFSATFSEEIKALSAQLLHNPAMVEVARQNSAAESVAQRVYAVEKERKRELLSHLVGTGNWKQVLVFVRTKHGADRLAAQLQRDGIDSASLHGDKSQGARTRALADFKSGKVAVLVATDIAARGLDIDQLPHVVNFELPNVPEDYVHRIGRTGRAGATGEALSLVSQDEAKLLGAIERLLKREVPRATEQGFEPGFVLRAQPGHQPPRRGDGGGHSRPANAGRHSRSRSPNDRRSSAPRAGRPQ